MTDSSLLNVVQERSDLANPERLAFLYANILPLKARNTSSFNTVVAWWHQLLLELIPKASQDHLVLHANGQLLARLATEESGRPLGLGCVLVSLDMLPVQTHG